MEFDFGDAFIGRQEMTREEYRSHCAEVSKRALMALIAKIEEPFGGGLSDILNDTVGRIERLQEKEK